MKFWVIIFTLSLASCVSSKKYKDLETAKSMSEQKLSNNLTDCEGRNTRCLEALGELEGHKASLERNLGAYLDSVNACRSELAKNEAFIKSLGDQLDDQKRKLAAELEAKNKMLQQKEIDLNNAMAKSEAERMNVEKLRTELEKTSDRIKNLERELNNKDSAVQVLKEEIAKALSGFDELDIKIENRNGKVYVSLAEKLLFKSGSISVDPKGQEALIKLASALNQKADVQVSVEGHTDNKPISSDKIKDNWDLSVLRATSIVRILTIDGKMNGNRITANGRGETQPVASNNTPEGRALNRRTEIILTPRLDKILDIINN